MDNNDLMKYEGDRLITNTDVDAPTGWTNDFERVRGHEWQENGNIANILGAAGIKGKAKPLFAFEQGNGEVLFQAGDSFYLYGPNNQLILRIENYSELESLASALDHTGFDDVETGPL